MSDRPLSFDCPSCPVIILGATVEDIRAHAPECDPLLGLYADD